MKPEPSRSSTSRFVQVKTFTEYDELHCDWLLVPVSAKAGAAAATVAPMASVTLAIRVRMMCGAFL